MLSTCLRDIIAEASHISGNGITVDEEKFDVEFYLGADKIFGLCLWKTAFVHIMVYMS